MSAFRTLDHADLKGKRVWCAPISTCRWRTAGSATAPASSAWRPTISEIADKGAKVIVLSHFGRPKGRDQKISLKPVAAAVAHASSGP